MKFTPRNIIEHYHNLAASGQPLEEFLIRRPCYWDPSRIPEYNDERYKRIYMSRRFGSYIIHDNGIEFINN